MNLVENLIDNYKKMPHKICLVENGEKITYENLYKKVCDFKEYLEKRGIKQESKILVLVPMSIDLYVVLLSIWSIGAVACFMDAGFIKSRVVKNGFEEIDGIIGNTKYLLYSNLNKNLSELKIKINTNILKTLKRKDEKEIISIKKIEEKIAILTYTSGTTGIPKIAARTHEFLQFQGKILKDNLDYEENDIELSTIPIFTLSNINAGITTVIANSNFSDLGKSNPKKIVEQINRNNINRIMASPGLLSVITKYCIKKDVKITNLKKIYTGGGAIFLDLIKELKITFPNAKITTLYGSTEAEPIAKLNINEMTNEDIKNVEDGKGILAGTIVGVEDCKIIKNDKKEIGKISDKEFYEMQTKDVGEIVVTGNNVLKGYLGGIGDKENKFIVDEKVYHRTGDVGTIDEKGRLWLRGRIKEPFLNIESALHLKLEIGKTAVLQSNDKIILVVERNNKVPEDILKNAIQFNKIDEIRYVKKIPVDKRHSTKVDYNKLRKILKID